VLLSKVNVNVNLLRIHEVVVVNPKRLQHCGTITVVVVVVVLIYFLQQKTHSDITVQFILWNIYKNKRNNIIQSVVVVVVVDDDDDDDDDDDGGDIRDSDGS
jgi:hypothetical protein